MNLLQKFRQDPETQRIKRENQMALDRLRAEFLGMSYKAFVERREVLREQAGK